MDNNSNQTERVSKLFGSSSTEWFVYKLPASFFWLWISLRFLNIQIPYWTEVSREYLLLFPGIAWLYLLISRKWRRFFIYPIYIIIVTPLGILVLIVKTILNIWKGSVRISRIARSTQLVIFLVIISIAGWVLTFTIKDKFIIAWTSTIAHTSFYFLFLQSFRWASNPFRPIFKAIDMVWGIAEWFFSTIIEMHDEDFYYSNEGVKYFLELMHKVFDYLLPQNVTLNKGIVGIVKNNLISIAIIGLCILYISLAGSFSILIFNIDKAWGPIFHGFSTPPTYFDYFYFAFTSQATAIPDTIQPITVLGEVLIIWLLMTGILLFSSLMVLFTTSVGFQGEQAINELKTFITGKNDRLLFWESKLTGYESVEDEVIDAKLIDKTVDED